MVSLDHISRFYEAAMPGLRALDGTRGRRFGPDADATWRAFRGKLSDGDRLDLLLRDASVAWAAAFAPRVVFALDGLADDEPFGPEWPGPAPEAAASLFTQRPPAGEPLLNLLREAARAWDLTIRPLARSRLAAITPASGIVAAGAGAIMALGAHFQAHTDLDLADQVLLVADRPAERQLFGLAALVVGAARPVRIALPTTPPEDVRNGGFARASVLVLSDDADDRARAAAESFGRELGVPR